MSDAESDHRRRSESRRHRERASSIARNHAHDRARRRAGPANARAGWPGRRRGPTRRGNRRPRRASRGAYRPRAASSSSWRDGRIARAPLVAGDGLPEVVRPAGVLGLVGHLGIDAVAGEVMVEPPGAESCCRRSPRPWASRRRARGGRGRPPRRSPRPRPRAGRSAAPAAPRAAAALHPAELRRVERAASAPS